MCQASGFWRGRDPTCEGVMHINNYYTSTSFEYSIVIHKYCLHTWCMLIIVDNVCILSISSYVQFEPKRF